MNTINFKLGIVILNYNNWDDTFECVESLLNFIDIDTTNIYIVDNNSKTSPNFEFLNKILSFNNIKIIYTKVNGGYSSGNNIGLNEAIKDNCDYFLITNNDVIFEEDSIKPMINYLNENKDVGIIGPRVYKLNGEIQEIGSVYEMNLSNKYKTLLNKLFLDLFFRKYNSKRQMKLSKEEVIKEMYYVSGCCFLFSKNSLKYIYPLDETFFLYYEEYNLGRILKQNQLKSIYYQLSSVIHKEGQSTKKIKFKTLVYILQSEYNFYINKMHYKLIYYLPIFIYRKIRIVFKIIFRKNFLKNYTFMRNQLIKVMMNEKYQNNKRN